MVGCKRDAEFIRKRHNQYPLPNGWTKLGEGSQRKVFLSPDKVVYKVELKKAGGSNSSEFFNIQRISELEPLSGWDLPDATLYEVSLHKTVLAMEFIEGEFDVECASLRELDCDCGDRRCVGLEWEVMTEVWSIYDVTYENVIVRPDGTRVLIDVAR